MPVPDSAASLPRASLVLLELLGSIAAELEPAIVSHQRADERIPSHRHTRARVLHPTPNLPRTVNPG